MRISQRRETAGQPMKAACPGGTTGSDEVIASSGVTFHLWRLYQHAWLACLFFPLVSLVREPGSPWPLRLRVRGFPVAALPPSLGFFSAMWPGILHPRRS